MEYQNTGLRKKVAVLARDFLENKITFKEFMNEAQELRDATGDEEIDNLVDSIYHLPKKGGFLGAPIKIYEEHMKEVRELIEKLSK